MKSQSSEFERTKEEVVTSNAKLSELSKQLEAQARELDASKAELLEKARLESDLEAATKEKSALQGDLHASREALKIEQAQKAELEGNLKAQTLEFERSKKELEGKLRSQVLDSEARLKSQAEELHLSREAFKKEKSGLEDTIKRLEKSPKAVPAPAPEDPSNQKLKDALKLNNKFGKDIISIIELEGEIRYMFPDWANRWIPDNSWLGLKTSFYTAFSYASSFGYDSFSIGRSLFSSLVHGGFYYVRNAFSVDDIANYLGIQSDLGKLMIGVGMLGATAVAGSYIIPKLVLPSAINSSGFIVSITTSILKNVSGHLAKYFELDMSSNPDILPYVNIALSIVSLYKMGQLAEARTMFKGVAKSLFNLGIMDIKGFVQNFPVNEISDIISKSVLTYTALDHTERFIHQKFWKGSSAEDYAKEYIPDFYQYFEVEESLSQYLDSKSNVNLE